MRLWTRLGGTARSREISALVVLALLTITSIFLVMGRSRSGKLHIVNGLDVAVTVEVGGHSVAIDPQSQSLVVRPNGPYLATTKTKEGKLVERAVVIVDSQPDAVVYNVLGAAPLLDVRLRYSVGPKLGDEARDVNFHGGERLAVVEGLDYVFTEPPKSISSQKSGGDIVKRALLLPPGGSLSTTTYLLGADRAADAVELQRRLLRLNATPIKTLNYTSESVWAAYGGEEAVVPLLAPIVRTSAITEDDVPARYLIAAGCRHSCDDTRRIVTSATPPGSLVRRLTLLRGLGEPDMRRAVAELSAEHSDQPDVVRARAWLALLDGKWSECAELYLRTSKSPYGDFDLEELATCLHAAGRHDEALAQAARVADSGGEAAWLGAVTYAQIAAAGKETAGTYIDKLEQDQAARAATKGVWLGIFDRKVEMPRAGSPLADTLALAQAAAESSDAGIERARAKPAAVRGLPMVLGLVLGAELARRGDMVAAERVLDANRGLRIPASALIDYVMRGTVHPLLFRLDPESRAGLDFVRARRVEELGQESHLLYAAARKRDLLHGWVHRLIGAWAPPERKNEVLVYTVR